jgi:hypothetical protein
LWNESRLNGAPHPWVGTLKGISYNADWLSAHNEPRIATTFRGERVEFFLRRGFVASVHAPLAVLFGGPCGRCGGDGRVESPNPQFTRRCPACEGTPGGDDYRCSGRTPGIVAALFASHPVVNVRLTDRQPLSISGSRLFSWINWSVDRRFQMPHQIPPELYALLPDSTEGTLIPVPGLYPTDEAAMDALSNACVAFGRKEAHLCSM